jgi:FkbM family methyltransferase
MHRFLKKIALSLLVFLPHNLGMLIWRLSGKSLGFNWDGGIDSEINDIERLLDSSLDSELLALDVGSNFGDWTLRFLNKFPSSHVYAFEPSAVTFEVLSTRLVSENRVTLINKAAGDYSGEANLFSDKPTSGMASLTRRELSHLGIDFSITEKVSIVTLRDWCAEKDVPLIDVLKLDVEGHELEVMLGLGELLPSIRLIQFEFGGTSLDTRKFFKDYWDLLTKHSFRILRATPRGPVEIFFYEEALEQFAFSTYYALKKRKV